MDGIGEYFPEREGMSSYIPPQEGCRFIRLWKIGGVAVQLHLESHSLADGASVWVT
jgi:hypothetical protein